MVMSFISGIGALELSVIVIPMLLMFALWIAAIIDIVRSNFSDQNQKLVWILIVVLVPLIGTILYFALGRTGRAKA